MLSAETLMHLVYIRNSLKDLTYIEQMHTLKFIISMYKIHGQQHEYRRKFINFKQHSQQFACEETQIFMAYFTLMLHLIFQVLNLTT